MNKETKKTKAYYASRVQDEWNRLVKDPFHQLEFNMTKWFLKQYLPSKGLVLDAGGGPGRYTIDLARMGLDVVLLDLMQEHLEFAKKEIQKAGISKRVKETVEGSITDLSHFKNSSFDAVLCLGGPICHVHPQSERAKAVKELIRVAKSNAPIFVSAMSKYGVLLATPEGWPQEVGNKQYFDDLIATGNDYHFGHTGFCHFFTSTELRKVLTSRNTEFVLMAGLEGFNSDRQTSNKFAEKYPVAWKNWLKINDRMCTDPFVIDASGHMLIIVRKK